MEQPHSPLRIAAIEENLFAVQEFVRTQARALGVPEQLGLKLELVSEELFLNVAHHATLATNDEVELHCSWQAGTEKTSPMFCLALRDWGAPFNPLEQRPPDLQEDLETRPIGGLGIHLVTQLADSCNYCYDQGSNLFIVCFFL